MHLLVEILFDINSKMSVNSSEVVVCSGGYRIFKRGFLKVGIAE